MRNANTGISYTLSVIGRSCIENTGSAYTYSSVHPLVYPHPSTGASTMCFHLGDAFFRCFATDYNPRSQDAVFLNMKESNAIRKRIVGLLENKNLMLEVKWEPGDLAIVDNLAVAHFASPGTQEPRSQAGLRILHRTTVAGAVTPLELKMRAMGK